MPMTEVLSVGPLILWAGTGRRVSRRLLEVARLRDRFPTIRELAARFGLDVASGEEWSEIVWTRLDGGNPVWREVYRVSPLGRLLPGETRDETVVELGTGTAGRTDGRGSSDE